MPAQTVVEEEARTNDPGWPAARTDGEYDPQRANEIWRARQKNLAFGKRFAYEAQLAVLEIAQSAVNEFSAGGRRGAGKVAFLQKQAAQAAPGGVEP